MIQQIIKKYIHKIIFIKLRLQCHLSTKLDEKIIRIMQLESNRYKKEQFLKNTIKFETGYTFKTGYIIQELNEIELNFIHIIIKMMQLSVKADTNPVIWNISIGNLDWEYYRTFYGILIPHIQPQYETDSIMQYYKETKIRKLKEYEQIKEIYDKYIEEIKKCIIKKKITTYIFIKIELYKEKEEEDLKGW